MSTNDVPGANPKNNDKLAMGVWAEHADGSLIFVESTEGNRVIYSVFDMDKEPPVEYRDAMEMGTFKRTFSWDASGKKAGTNEKWTWHDKTPFPWDKVIEEGVDDGPRVPSARQQLNAAERVAESLRLRGAALDREEYSDRLERVFGRFQNTLNRIHDAVRNMGRGRGAGNDR
jgi:hypothetical protein